MDVLEQQGDSISLNIALHATTPLLGLVLGRAKRVTRAVTTTSQEKEAKDATAHDPCPLKLLQWPREYVGLLTTNAMRPPDSDVRSLAHVLAERSCYKFNFVYYFITISVSLSIREPKSFAT